MYDPPSPTNWYYTHPFDSIYAESYNAGYRAFKEGKKEDENPWPPSGHERDTNLNDELGYWWFCGFHNAEEEVP